ncbi:SGNH/GDSL hydrolase family protein [Methylopila henanensis]|uniref:SGNH/GDSL hydrolase family protein n=1 Tax=Methylopila henanensis TaxID=873516 RepID=A0ABW4KAP7_9HYPH
MASAVSLLRAGLLAGFAMLGGSAGVAEPARPCKVADEHLAMTGKLDRAIAQIKSGDVFKILVIGSSSTAGVGATAPEKAYTERFEEELERRLAGVDVDVVARGIGGETAAGADARLERELAAVKPDLVVWQIGTNDAARRVALDGFRETTARGLKRIAKAGIDVALLDPQFVPQDEAVYAPYIAALDQLSAATGVPVAHRYAAMRALAKAGAADMLSRDRLHMNDGGHACVGAFLAEALGRKLAPLPAVAEATKRS